MHMLMCAKANWDRLIWQTPLKIVIMHKIYIAELCINTKATKIKYPLAFRKKGVILGA